MDANNYDYHGWGSLCLPCPTLTGGIGYNVVYSFHNSHFSGKMPKDMKITDVSISGLQTPDLYITLFATEKVESFALDAYMSFWDSRIMTIDSQKPIPFGWQYFYFLMFWLGWFWYCLCNGGWILIPCELNDSVSALWNFEKIVGLDAFYHKLTWACFFALIVATDGLAFIGFFFNFKVLSQSSLFLTSRNCIWRIF